MGRFDEAVDQIAAVWDLIADREGWRARLDVSVDGVFNSFWAMAYTAPLALGLYAVAWRTQEKLRAMSDGAADGFQLPDIPFNAYLAIKSFSFFAVWAGSLLLLVMLTRTFQRSDKAGLTIVAYNWVQSVVTGVQLAVLGLVAAFPNPISGTILTLSAYGFIVYAYWGMIRRSFERDIGVSLAIIAMLVLLEVAITSFIGAIVGGVLQLFA